MKGKKTFPIPQLKELINQFLLDSKDEYVQSRIDMGNLLETALMCTHNYRGFSYLTVRDMKQSVEGTTVRINTDEDDENLKTYEEMFNNTDNTRVRYF